MSARVLVVHDSEVQRDLLAVLLEHAGFQVAAAGHGGEALERLLDHPADLVITDLDMPVVDGWELARRLRALAGCGGIPVIILGRQEETGASAAPDPSTFFLPMPADPRVLVQHARRALAPRGGRGPIREESP